MRVPILVLVVSALLSPAGCSRAPVLTIQNQSSVTLSNVLVSGSGFSERIAPISAGGEHRLSLRPRGESGVRLPFDAGTHPLDSGAQGYLEAGGGHCLTATVGTNLSVVVS